MEKTLHRSNNGPTLQALHETYVEPKAHVGRQDQDLANNGSENEGDNDD